MAQENFPKKLALIQHVKSDALVKRQKAVIPAKAGIQKLLILLDPGLRRGDEMGRFRTFYGFIKSEEPKY